MSDKLEDLKKYQALVRKERLLLVSAVRERKIPSKRKYDRKGAKDCIIKKGDP